MKRLASALAVIGAVLLVVSFGSVFTGAEKAMAEPYSYSFTYTGTDTVKTTNICNTTTVFQSLITNTGILADTYTVSWAEYSPPTPQDWYAEFCVGGICHDSTITSVTIGLDPTQTAEVLMDVKPRSSGQGKHMITVTSKFTGSSKTKTFLLGASCGPVTGRWGLVILILLIFISATYLIARRYRWARQT
ncbi:MAG: hypothetical protein WCE90_03800 [Candidatus Zixiibacteriota bacterium]